MYINKNCDGKKNQVYRKRAKSEKYRAENFVGTSLFYAIPELPVMSRAAACVKGFERCITAQFGWYRGRVYPVVPFGAAGLFFYNEK